MNQVDTYLYGLNEGKTWDAVKKGWRDHGGKIVGTAVAGAAAYGAYRGGKAIHGGVKNIIATQKAAKAAKAEEELKKKNEKEDEKKRPKPNREFSDKKAEEWKKKTAEDPMGGIGVFLKNIPKPKPKPPRFSPEEIANSQKRHDELEAAKKEATKSGPSYKEKVAASIQRAHEKRLELEKNKK